MPPKTMAGMPAKITPNKKKMTKMSQAVGSKSSLVSEGRKRTISPNSVTKIISLKLTCHGKRNAPATPIRNINPNRSKNTAAQ